MVNQQHYIGHTSDLSKRLAEHNNGSTKSTSRYYPYKVIYTEEYNSKGEAIKREKQIKSYKSGNAFKKLLGRDGRVVKCNSL